MVTKRYRILAIVACVGMLLVLLAGALVTNTDSGRGCGDDWPLCHGKFIPAYTLESLLEYTHRVVSAVVGFIVLALFAATVVYHRNSREALFYTGSALFFTILQALLGAAAVKNPQSPPIMALHFGFSLLALASTMLIVMWAWRRRGRTLQEKPSTVPHSVYLYSWALFVYTYIVVYIGAYIRHTDSAGGCTGWPLCNGEVVPELTGATGIVFIHRVAALLLFICLAALFWHVRAKSGHAGLVNTARWMVWLVLTQIFSGALLTFTVTNENVFIFTSLIHNVIVAVYFGLLCDLGIRSWRYRKGRGA